VRICGGGKTDGLVEAPRRLAGSLACRRRLFKFVLDHGVEPVVLGQAEQKIHTVDLAPDNEFLTRGAHVRPEGGARCDFTAMAPRRDNPLCRSAAHLSKGVCLAWPWTCALLRAVDGSFGSDSPVVLHRRGRRLIPDSFRARRMPITAESGHVWTAPGWQELSSRVQQWSEQPCVRPVSITESFR